MAGSNQAAPRAAPLTFREWVCRAWPGYQWYRHCALLADVLQRVADGKLNRVMVFMPPRHGKSQAVSRLFSAYYLYRYPERWVGLASYGAELAYTLSRASRQFYVAMGDELASSAAAVKHWETPRGGGLWAAGVGGPITGKGWHLGIIDDPLKNSEEAQSAAIREKQKEWYQSSWYTREEPGAGACVVIQTRWHEDDLSGWLLAEEAEDDRPERWHIVSWPAIAEPEPLAVPSTCTLEPDWRRTGEALCPERHSVEHLRQIERTVGGYAWSALYQQRPRPREGGLFKREWFETVEAPPLCTRWVRFWDCAAKAKESSDYTAGALVGRTHSGEWVIADVVRGRWEYPDAKRVILQTAVRDGKGVPICIEDTSSGTAIAQDLLRDPVGSGYSIRAVSVTADKYTRAAPWAAQAEGGLVRLVRGAWVSAFLDEVCSFPSAAHDDQVDAASGAFAQLAQTVSGTPTTGTRRPLTAGLRW
ncbi:MAG: phage terminase large subunit [bacterium]|nr:phage terminase large subunit [bacterium]